MPTFAFQTTRPDGTRFDGTLDAASIDDARQQLAALALRVDVVREAAQPAHGARLSAADLEQFNEQLLQLAAAGLPLERGLDLLARDMRRSPLKSAMQGLASDLSAGKPIDKALDDRRGQFPPIYARLIDAGIQTSNLPGVLHGFGRHVRLIGRLRHEVWRACAYPAVVLLSFCLLMWFISTWVLPQYLRMLEMRPAPSYRYVSGSLVSEDTVPQQPLSATVLYHTGRAMPFVLIGIGLIVAVLAGGWALLWTFGRERVWVDRVLLRLPLLGRALRHNYVARWTDTLAIAVRAGLDLPKAIALAGQVVALPSLQRDGDVLTARLQSGQSLDALDLPLTRVPASVPPAIALASAAGNLPNTLDALAGHFARQAEERVRLIPAVLMPVMVIIIGFFAGFILYGLWAPILKVFESFMF